MVFKDFLAEIYFYVLTIYVKKNISNSGFKKKKNSNNYIFSHIQIHIHLIMWLKCYYTKFLSTIMKYSHPYGPQEQAMMIIGIG